FLRMENDQPLCLTCADLDHLVFLPRGDAALTRRASKYTNLRVIVVRFSRARKRYERRGVLVAEAALIRAEKECLDDAESRARARERSAIRREAEDRQYIAAFQERIADVYPNCPDPERSAIAEHACAKGSGRIGRSASAKELDASAVDLAVGAHVRHVHTAYDELMGSGMSRSEARSCVKATTEKVLAGWRGS
ncbi:MAG TPA: DUF2293 domain-containing protein, partial [Longimicrobiaceae bacterium]|nr:DUF2293 domain-containing protein [Longimicrobiaceae bacterium]